MSDSRGQQDHGEMGRYAALGILLLASTAAFSRVGPSVLRRLVLRLEPQLAEIGKLALPVGRVLLLVASATAVVLLVLRTYRWVCTRRTLRSRPAGRYLVLPTNTFAPSVADVSAFAEGLGGTQRAVRAWADRPARAVRFLFTANSDSELECRWEVPSESAAALLTAGTAYGEVEAMPVEDEG